MLEYEAVVVEPVGAAEAYTADATRGGIVKSMMDVSNSVKYLSGKKVLKAREDGELAFHIAHILLFYTSFCPPEPTVIQLLRAWMPSECQRRSISRGCRWKSINGLSEQPCSCSCTSPTACPALRVEFDITDERLSPSGISLHPVTEVHMFLHVINCSHNA